MHPSHIGAMPAVHMLSCQNPDWEEDLLYLLASDYEVDLADFDYDKHGAFCEDVAKRFMVKVSVNRDPRAKALHFRQLELRNVRPRARAG